MTELDTKAIITGPITPTEAQTLGHEHPDSLATQEVLKKIGATAQENAVALVVTTDENGNERPSHFVGLHPDDMGTRYNPAMATEHSLVTQLNLPTPEAAHAELQKRAEQQPLK